MQSFAATYQGTTWHALDAGEVLTDHTTDAPIFVLPFVPVSVLIFAPTCPLLV